MSERGRAEQIELEPHDCLKFTLQKDTTPESILTIRNISSAKVAFKVKTTQPRRYLVRPNQGMVAEGESTTITVILQQRDCEELILADPRDRDNSNDKFLVQSVGIDEEFYHALQSKPSKEQTEELAQMWSNASKKELSNKKLKCQFVMGTIKTDLASSSEFAAPPPFDAAPSRAAPPRSASSMMETARLDDSQMISEVASLRKKYDELVAFTVQLTAQRDQLMTDLEKSKQKANKYQAEAEKAKESGLRHRTRGSAGADATSDAVSTQPAQAEGFKLFHLLVVAMFCFLIGKFFR